jgi:hypothetical protein
MLKRALFKGAPFVISVPLAGPVRADLGDERTLIRRSVR